MLRAHLQIINHDRRFGLGNILIVVGGILLLGAIGILAGRAILQSDDTPQSSPAVIAVETPAPTQPELAAAPPAPTATSTRTSPSTASPTATPPSSAGLKPTRATMTSTAVATTTPQPTSQGPGTATPAPSTTPPTANLEAPGNYVAPTATPTPEPPEAVDQAVNGDPVHISIPAVGINTDVVEVGYELINIGGQTVIRWNVASWAAGHQLLSADPGQGGNVVIAGHVIGNGAVFSTLDQAEVGDEVIVTTPTGEYRYTVEEVHVRLDEGAPLDERLAIGQFMAPMPEERLTLITCWPDGVYNQRLIVVAKPG